MELSAAQRQALKKKKKRERQKAAKAAVRAVPPLLGAWARDLVQPATRNARTQRVVLCFASRLPQRRPCVRSKAKASQPAAQPKSGWQVTYLSLRVLSSLCVWLLPALARRGSLIVPYCCSIATYFASRLILPVRLWDAG